jgi:hypothetical protein
MSVKNIIDHINHSRDTLRAAWEGKSAQLSGKLSLLGVSLKPNSVLKSINENEPQRNCILKVFKIFFAATYLSDRTRGEIIFADLVSFRRLLLGTMFPIEDGEEKFLRANRRWIEILDARVRHDKNRFKDLMRQFSGEIVGLGDFQYA